LLLLLLRLSFRVTNFRINNQTGITDASEVIGDGWFLLALQEGTFIDGEVRDDGQLLAMYRVPLPPTCLSINYYHTDGGQTASDGALYSIAVVNSGSTDINPVAVRVRVLCLLLIYPFVGV
jgi:hypothetical protein